MNNQPLFQCRITSIDQLPLVLDGLEQTGSELDWDPSFQMQIALVVEELMVNCISYGGRPKGQGWAEVRLEKVSQGLAIVIDDNGQAFDPFSAAQPDTELDIESRSIGGLGVHFVREMADSYAYERLDELNRVTLFKRLTTAQ